MRYYFYDYISLHMCVKYFHKCDSDGFGHRMQVYDNFSSQNFASVFNLNL